MKAGLILVMICGFNAMSSAAAESASCSERLKELVPAAMKMAYWEFDQTEAGWRKLEECDAEKAQLLDLYVKKQEANMRNLRWHLAQTLALSGENSRAAEEAMKALNPDEARLHPNFSWNSYLQASVGFLRNDRAAFDVHYEALRLAIGKSAGNESNFKALSGLAKCFGKSYKEAYINCRTAP